VGGLSEQEIDAFAEVFVDERAARHLLEDAGLSMGRHAPWNAGSAVVFWREVSRHLTHGAIDHGRQRLCAAALKQYPHNPVFVAGWLASTLGAPHDPASWPGYQRLAERWFAHRRVYLAVAERSEAVRGNLLGMCWYLRETARPTDARSASTVLRATFEDTLGATHPDTLTATQELANAMLVGGEHEPALQLYRELLALRTAVLSAQHRDTLTTAANLGIALTQLGRLDEARSQIKAAFHERDRLFGDSDPDTVTSMLNLADCHRRAGDYAAARGLDAEARTIYHRRLGTDHPATLSASACLGDDLLRLARKSIDDGRPSAALPVLQDARTNIEESLRGRRRVLGTDHPDTLTSASLVVTVLFDLGLGDAARRVAEEWLPRFVRVLGPDAKNTIALRRNLEVIHQSLHR
jgi:tetratricopeptide (TPR) repeat protein